MQPGKGAALWNVSCFKDPNKQMEALLLVFRGPEVRSTKHEEIQNSAFLPDEKYLHGKGLQMLPFVQKCKRLPCSPKSNLTSTESNIIELLAVAANENHPTVTKYSFPKSFESNIQQLSERRMQHGEI